MGDVGSTFLGAVFAGVVLQAPSWLEAVGILLMATPLLGDACLCVTRRLVTGQSIFQAHRLHLYQRLYQAGWSHESVALLYIISSFILALAFVIGGLTWVIILSISVMLLGVWLDKNVAVAFGEASRY